MEISPFLSIYLPISIAISH